MLIGSGKLHPDVFRQHVPASAASLQHSSRLSPMYTRSMIPQPEELLLNLSSISNREKARQDSQPRRKRSPASPQSVDSFATLSPQNHHVGESSQEFPPLQTPSLPSIESVFLSQPPARAATAIWEASTFRLVAYDAAFTSIFDLALDPLLHSTTGVRWTDLAGAAFAYTPYINSLRQAAQETVARITIFATQMQYHHYKMQDVSLLTKTGRLLVCYFRLYQTSSHLYPNEKFIVWFVDAVFRHPSVVCTQAAEFKPMLQS